MVDLGLLAEGCQAWMRSLRMRGGRSSMPRQVPVLQGPPPAMVNLVYEALVGCPRTGEDMREGCTRGWWRS